MNVEFGGLSPACPAAARWPRRVVLTGAGEAWPGLVDRPQQLLHDWHRILQRLGEAFAALPNGLAQVGRTLQFVFSRNAIVLVCTGTAWTQQELSVFKNALVEVIRARGAVQVRATVEF